MKTIIRTLKKLSIPVILSFVTWYSFTGPSKSKLKYQQKIIQEKEQARIDSIVQLGDLAVIEAFENNQISEKIAGESSLNLIKKYLGDDFGWFSEHKEIDLNTAQKSFLLQQKIHGLNKFCQSLYENYSFKNYSVSNTNSGEWWRHRVKRLRMALSQEANQELQRVVFEEMKDPFWVHLYTSSDQEMVDLLKTEKFKNKHKYHFVKRSGDTLFMKKFASQISNKEIIQYKIINVIPKKRRNQIAKTMELDDAYNLFLDSGVDKDERKRLISLRKFECTGYDLLFYFATDNLTKSEVISVLNVLSTEEMIGNFPKRVVVDIWSFSNDIFMKKLISSVKTRTDYEMAIEFIDWCLSPKRAALFTEKLNERYYKNI